MDLFFLENNPYWWDYLLSTIDIKEWIKISTTRYKDLPIAIGRHYRNWLKNMCNSYSLILHICADSKTNSFKKIVY